MITRPKHCVIIGNQAETMLRFRGGLIALLRERGAQVTAMCPPATPAEARKLDALGVRHVAITGMRRSSLNPAGDLMLVRELTAKLRAAAPDAVLSYFLKPAIWGTLAAARAGVPIRIAMIEGLGFAFSDLGAGKARWKQGIARAAVGALLRFAMPRATVAVVLNSDDASFLRANLGVNADKLVQLDGIGVDLTEYAALPVPEGPPAFCLAARLIGEKGVREFAAAARDVRAAAPRTRFLLLGDTDDAPGAVPRSEVQGWVAEGFLEWPGKVDDVRPYLAQSSVFVLPSAYGEGLPRSIMEAMAMGRAVVTSTTTGCRESITDGVSGFLVAPRDVSSLTRALMRFVRDEELAPRMGLAAAEEATRRYDQRVHNGRLADLLLKAAHSTS